MKQDAKIIVKNGNYPFSYSIQQENLATDTIDWDIQLGFNANIRIVNIVSKTDGKLEIWGNMLQDTNFDFTGGSDVHLKNLHITRPFVLEF